MLRHGDPAHAYVVGVLSREEKNGPLFDGPVPDGPALRHARSDKHREGSFPDTSRPRKGVAEPALEQTVQDVVRGLEPPNELRTRSDHPRSKPAARIVHFSFRTRLPSSEAEVLGGPH